MRNRGTATDTVIIRISLSLFLKKAHNVQQRISSKCILAKVFTNTHAYMHADSLVFFLLFSILFRLSHLLWVFFRLFSQLAKKCSKIMILLSNQKFTFDNQNCVQFAYNSHSYARRTTSILNHAYISIFHEVHQVYFNFPCSELRSVYQPMVQLTPLLIAILIDQ